MRFLKRLSRERPWRFWYRPWLFPWLLALLGTVCVAGAGCAVSSPFRGPGVSRWSGRLNLDPEQSVVVAWTQARLDPDRRKSFDQATHRVFRELGSQPGLLGYSVRTRIGAAEVWTMTVWMDEASLDAFLASKLHRSAIRDGRGSLVGGRTLRRSFPAAKVPLPWAMAEGLLEREGTDVMSSPDSARSGAAGKSEIRSGLRGR